MPTTSTQAVNDSFFWGSQGKCVHGLYPGVVLGLHSRIFLANVGSELFNREQGGEFRDCSGRCKKLCGGAGHLWVFTPPLQCKYRKVARRVDRLHVERAIISQDGMRHVGDYQVLLPKG